MSQGVHSLVVVAGVPEPIGSGNAPYGTLISSVTLH